MASNIPSSNVLPSLPSVSSPPTSNKQPAKVDSKAHDQYNIVNPTTNQLGYQPQVATNNTASGASNKDDDASDYYQYKLPPILNNNNTPADVVCSNSSTSSKNNTPTSSTIANTKNEKLPSIKSMGILEESATSVKESIITKRSTSPENNKKDIGFLKGEEESNNENCIVDHQNKKPKSTAPSKKKQIKKCLKCNKQFKQGKALLKHQLEHTPYYEQIKKITTKKSQQIRVLEVAMILASMKEKVEFQHQEPSTTPPSNSETNQNKNM